MNHTVRVGLAATVIAIHTGIAQELPVRQIGRLEHVTSDSTLASVSSALALPAGRVLVNDRVGHRVLLLDSTLSHETVVADTTPVTDNAYGRRPDNLIRFRGDTALLIDPSSLSMYVIGPAGTIARTMAIPRAGDADAVELGAAVDGSGRLVYFNSLGSLPGAVMLGVGDAVTTNGKPTALARFNVRVDSAPLVRVDLATRRLDTIASVKIPKLFRELKTDGTGGLTAIETTYDPLPVVDAWTTTSDGRIAILRSRDYHIDWLERDGRWVSTPQMPFDWQRVDDSRKQRLIDSTVAHWKQQYDYIMGSGRGRGASSLAPLVAARADPASMPDYTPPITDRLGALAGDADGNVWIRTTTMVAGQPVYDVVNGRGELFDRVQLPPFRTIAGFGPGVIYMAVKDATGVVHLERARIR